MPFNTVLVLPIPVDDYSEYIIVAQESKFKRIREMSFLGKNPVFWSLNNPSRSFYSSITLKLENPSVESTGFPDSQGHPGDAGKHPKLDDLGSTAQCTVLSP